MPRMSEKEKAERRECVAKAIDDYRLKCKRGGVSAGGAAASMGFTRATLYNRINNIGALSLDELMDIANAANISMKTLLGLS